MNQRYDEQTFDVIRRTPGNYVDVGCHAGSILREMLKISPDGQHVAFEPLPHLAATLRHEFPSVQVFEAAASDSVAETEFTFAKMFPEYSGIRQIEYPGATEIEKIRVKTDTIDNLVTHSIQLIKIDVEGAEWGVLKGAEQTIRANRPIIVFEHGSAAKAFGTDSSELFDFLVDCGLTIYLMEKWLKGRKALPRADFLRNAGEGPNWYFMAAP